LTLSGIVVMGADIIVRQGVRLARWRDGKGKVKPALLTTEKGGADRIREESSTYDTRHRDGHGIVVELPTGCRDKTAAQRVLSDLERRAEKVRVGVLQGCGFENLAGLERSSVEHWLNRRRQGGTSGRTRDIDLTRLIASANWCVVRATGTDTYDRHAVAPTP
jgi:hypothetical protein